jgi:uncharacterized protein YjeT (DUF2065 family)
VNSRRLLQLVNAVVGVLTVGLGTVQFVFGVRSPLYAAAQLPDFAMLDSNLRFFGGMAVGIGLALLWLVPSIERHGPVFRVVWLCAFLGGVGRLVSWPLLGSPGTMLLVFTAIEVLGAPALVYWQHRVASSGVVR